jgi:hypothetical protein
MAGNIYGYQGVHTPLESVTQGRYTLSDYTSMRTELTSRLIALENQGGFVPTNVEITGYLHMLPGSAGAGEIETTSSITGNSLYINTEAHCGNFLCDNGAVINGTTTFGGNVTVNGGAILSGNGSGLTNINDITKLPLTGGNISGTLSVGGTLGMLGNATASQSNPIVVAGDSLIVASDGGMTAKSVTITTLSSTTAGLRITPTSVLLGAGGSNALYPTASISCTANSVILTGNTATSGTITVNAPGTFIGNGSGLTGITSTDPTKLPLAGGTLTGQLNSQNIFFGSGYSGYNYKKNLFTSIENSLGVTYTIAQSNSSVHDYIRLEYNNACTVSLANLATQSDTYYQDKMRKVTITKKSMALGDYVVTLLPPTGYLFYNATNNGVASTTIPLGTFSVTYLINYNTTFSVGAVDLIAKI